MTLLVDIEKKIGNFHLKAAFTMNHRENFGLLGESGCGKSMTLKCIAGIMTPDKGKIILNDRVLYDSEKKINLSPQKRKVGYLFQDYALFPNMNVEQNIAVVLKNKNRTKEYLEQFYLKGLEKFHLKQKELEEHSLNCLKSHYIKCNHKLPILNPATINYHDLYSDINMDNMTNEKKAEIVK